MNSEAKSIKAVAKEAKMRLKSRFWEDYKKEVDSGVKKAGEDRLARSGVENYFKSKVIRFVKGESKEDENFYAEVRAMLDKYGKPSNALSLLMDKPYFKTLSYEEKERYLFRLSERYLKAIERYDRERKIELELSK